MKNIMARGFLTLLTLIVTIAVSLASLAPMASAEDHSCSKARAAGKWSFTDSGTVIGIGQRAAAGMFTLDADGNLSNGVAASSLNGNVANETFSGTYTLNSDCTGSFDVKIYAGSAELFEITAFVAFDDNMREIRAVFTSVVAPNGTPLPAVISLQARRQ
jgi:hypothetical protein